MIEVTNLSKHYGDLKAVDKISFSVARGEVVGLLGPNGAGKTTTLRMLATSMEPSSGSLKISGIEASANVSSIRQKIGYLPDYPPLYRELTTEEYLNFIAKVRNLSRSERKSRVEEVMNACKLIGVREQLCGNLSRGFCQRVGIAQAIIHKPEVIILDEPTTGLDPRQIREMRDLIRGLKEFSAVLLSTHALSEVSLLCDRVVVMNRGQITLKQELKQESDVESVENMFLSAVANY